MAVFDWHLRPPTSGSLLADYTVEQVWSASGEPPDGRALRTVVVYAHHSRQSTIELAIKISPVYTEERRDTFVREQQIHYALTQIDSPGVRAAATRDDPSLFSADAAEHDADVRQTIMDEPYTFNVIPLYDYSIHAERLTIPNVVGIQKLLPYTLPTDNTPLSFLVQRRFESPLYEYVKNQTSLSNSAYLLYYTVIQLCCVFHLLLPIKFTHGDVHLGNIGVRPALGVPRHYWIAKNGVIRIPADIPCAVLIDFDNSSAVMTDATGKRFDMRPSQASLDRRFAGHARLTPEQTFSPMVDVFRLIESAIFLLASQVVDANVTKDVDQEELRRLANFGVLCLACFEKLPDKIKKTAEFANLNAFATALKDEQGYKKKAQKITGTKTRPHQQSLWWRLYAETPVNIRETVRYTMPWDALQTQPLFVDPDPGSVNFTPYCVIGKGSVYRSHTRPRPTDRENLRLDPLWSFLTAASASAAATVQPLLP